MMIAVQKLSKQFPASRTVGDGSKISAVNEMTFAVEPGCFLAIVGRSGSGKSTLLAMAGAISRPTSGSVDIGGTDIWRLDENARADFRNRNIGFVFQFASLLPALRAIDNVALPALISGALSYREAYARARALLERVGLADRLDFYPGQLSGGEQRRVAIARALINAPPVLFADEPTADLDEETEQEILNLLVDIHKAFKLTLVIVTHNKEIADKADQVLEMRAGQALEVRADQAVEVRPRLVLAGVDKRLGGVGGSGLNDAEVSSPAVALSGGDQASRLQNIFDISLQQAAKEEFRLGEGIERFIGRFALWTLPVIIVAWLINTAAATYEHNVIQAKANQRMALEDLAMSGLRAEVKDVIFGPGNSYVLSIYLRNTTGEQPIYIMSPTVRGFVQIGSSWQEAQLKPIDSSAGQVLKIEGEKMFHYSFEPDVKDFAQLLPYYMHVRFSNDMLISPRSQPQDDLIERNDNYYVYLKPHNADDKAILTKLKFPGVPPIWIPMPPH